MQTQTRVRLDPPEYRQVDAVVRPGDRDDGDGPHVSMSIAMRVPAGIRTRAVRPTSCGRIAGGRPVPGRRIAITCSVSTAPVGISTAATRLFRATRAIEASPAAGTFRP